MPLDLEYFRRRLTAEHAEARETRARTGASAGTVAPERARLQAGATTVFCASCQQDREAPSEDR